MKIFALAVNNVNKLVNIYRNGSLISLFKTLVQPLTLVIDPIAIRLLSINFEKWIVDSKELKKYSSRFWELDYGPKLTIREQRELIPFEENANLNFRNIPTYTFDEPFVAEIPDVHVVGPIPFALTKDGKIISDVIHYNVHKSTGKNRLYRRIKHSMLESPYKTAMSLTKGTVRFSPEKSIQVASILGYPYDNFCIWIERELPKLRGIEKFEEETGEEVTLLLPDSTPDYVFEALTTLGRENYVIWDGYPVFVERLIAPSYPQPYRSTLEWLRENLKAEYVTSPVDSDWIFISRQSSDKGRRIQNFDEMATLMEKFNVEIVRLEEMGLQEQIATFQRVDGVIGPHGAGLVGMIWTNNLSIIEIFNEVVNAPYYILADILGHDYSAIIGWGVGDYHHPKDRDILVDLNELEQLMTKKIE